ncbi:hypothetical protein BGY98DRAFT_1096835 [Russula aff. rugulosa BPL654]|nr:hypothetical protein BGY98DRAFT_1096835 [Russula aff. rugulosa BPL654]
MAANSSSANTTNIITALGNAFKDPSGAALPNDRLAAVLLQNMNQLNDLAKQGKLNQQQIMQLRDFADKHPRRQCRHHLPLSLHQPSALKTTTGSSTAMLSENAISKDTYPISATLNPTNTTAVTWPSSAAGRPTPTGGITVAANSSSVNTGNIITAHENAFNDPSGAALPNDRLAAVLLQNMNRLNDLARQGKLNQQQIMQLRDYADKHKPKDNSTRKLCMYCDVVWNHPDQYKDHLREHHPNLDPDAVLGKVPGSQRRDKIIARPYKTPAQLARARKAAV